MPTIIPTSIKLKLKILFSVLCTVLKFLFSLVRKYFCILLIVDNCDETLNIVSSNAECCDGSAPPFFGIAACFVSSSTCCSLCISTARPFSCLSDEVEEVNKKENRHTAISKSTILSANVLISLLKQNLYSPVCCAVKT